MSLNPDTVLQKTRHVLAVEGRLGRTADEGGQAQAERAGALATGQRAT